MSMRSVTATGMETVSPGLSPCLGVAITDNLSYGQSGVKLNETLQIVFLGTPPFNLTSTVCNNNDTCWCGTQSQILDTTTYTWTVDSVNVRYGDSRLDVFTELGHSMIWSAVEMNNVSVTEAQFSFSPNFSLSSSSFDNQPSGAASHGPRRDSLWLTALGVLSLAVFGNLIGV